jgi:CRISPR-associated endonuclease Csn1
MNLKYRLGIDLGTNSIGWCMVEIDENGIPFKVYKMGCRIFSDGRDPQNGVSLAATRTLARGQRQRRDRFLKRRSKLLIKLKSVGLFPSDRKIGLNLASLNPYELRAKAVIEKLEPFKLGRALIHLAQRRGFKSNRKSGNADEAKITGPAIESLDNILKDKTLGQFLLNRMNSGQSTRFRPDNNNAYELYPTRRMYEDEFKAIRSKQEPCQNLSSEDWDIIFNIIFHQNPLKPQERGGCRFLKSSDGKPLPRANVALPSFQEFKILSDVNHLAYRDGINNEYSFLAEPQKVILLNLLKTQKAVKFDKLRAKLNLPDTALFNLKSDKRDGLNGDIVGYTLSKEKYFGEKWHGLSIESKDEIVAYILDDTTESQNLYNKAKNEWHLSDDNATAISVLTPADFPKGMAPFSGEFIRRVIEPMRNGMKYSEAVTALGFKHSDFSQDGNEDALPYYGKAFPDACAPALKSKVADEQKYGKIGNPTVHIALNQLRIVVNSLIAKYGKPSEIAIELARNLKLPKKRLDELDKEQNKNKKINDLIREQLAELRVEDSYENRLRYKLWNELKNDSGIKLCPYSGNVIPQSILFSDRVEIDHILPFALTLDDSPANKIICLRETNRAKRRKSPFEAFGSDTEAYAKILDRISVLPGNKRWRFEADAMKKFKDTQGFLTRQLTDTQYLSKVASRYLTCICAKDKVRVFPGRLTALLRHYWGLDTLLTDPESDRIVKNRADHRHHAIDALVVALSDRHYLEKIQLANKLDYLSKIQVPLPWETMRTEANQQVKNIIVSHRLNHNPSGRLHEETAYGEVRKERRRDSQKWEIENGYNLVVRKSILNLKSSDIETIRDVTLRTKLVSFLGTTNSNDMNEWNTKLLQYKNLTGTKTIRLLKKDKSAKLLSSAGGLHAKYIIPGDIYSITFWLLPDKKIEFYALELFEAAKGNYVQKRHPAAKMLFTVRKGDALRTIHKGELKIVTVVGISPSEANRNLVVLHNAAADKSQKFKIQFSRILATKTRLISIDSIGNIQDSGPRV